MNDAIQTSHPVTPFSSCPQSFPATRSLPVSWLFASGGLSIGASASASVLPMNVQDQFPLWLSWSPCNPRDCQESSTALQFKSISSLVLSLLYGPTLTSILDYWKNHGFDYTDLCWQSNNVSAFKYTVLFCQSFSSNEQASLNLTAAVILEPKKINTVTLSARRRWKILHCHCYPIYLPWGDGTRSFDLHFFNVVLYTYYTYKLCAIYVHIYILYIYIYIYQFSSVQSLSCVQLFATP